MNTSIVKNYKNLKVLITGSTGFKGSWLSFLLSSFGATVIGVGLKEEKESVLFRELNLHKMIKQYIFDIKNFEKLNKVVRTEKPDIIFHLAAQSVVSTSYQFPLRTFNTNIIGSVNLLECYRLNNIPALVFITSDKCYLNLDLKKSYKETDKLGGKDNYSSSKASAELIFSSYFNSYFRDRSKFLTVASARAGNVIGGGDMKVNRIIPDIVKSIKNNKKLIIRQPNSTRPWQHVMEPLSGYLTLGNMLLNNKIKSNIYPSWNFGPEKKNCKTVIKLVRKFLSFWPISRKIYLEKKIKMHESKYLSLNINKSFKELNWKPKLSFDETVKTTVEWYKLYLEKNNLRNKTMSQIEFFLNK